ncbi:7293_t:CDS:2 [Ambispora leptoticha]|uniref:7293_t:CDS:1 n=1 Tax=Ambispora leptoticha TaxID=144679 RepID=A0A9N8ZZ28_9GLOM|nr:7293_t:CDS:2 [Ambispora leptoticha]
MANTKVTLTITIPENVYKKLKEIVAAGKVSEFVSRAIEESISKKEKQIIEDYQKVARDKKLKISILTRPPEEEWADLTLWEKPNDYIIVALVVLRENDEEVRKPLEVHCECEGKKLKVLFLDNSLLPTLAINAPTFVSEITKEVNKKGKINSEETTKKVITTFLETIQQKLVQGESVNFKGYFTVKRSATQPKGNKNCDEHQRELDKFKQANKGKGIAAYTKSNTFRNLVVKTRNCSKCEAKKQQLAKSAKLTNRINFKPSKDFWKEL